MYNQRLEEKVSRDFSTWGDCPFISIRSDPKGEGPRLGKKKQSRARLNRVEPTS